MLCFLQIVMRIRLFDWSYESFIDWEMFRKRSSVLKASFNIWFATMYWISKLNYIPKFSIIFISNLSRARFSIEWSRNDSVRETITLIFCFDSTTSVNVAKIITKKSHLKNILDIVQIFQFCYWFIQFSSQCFQFIECSTLMSQLIFHSKWHASVTIFFSNSDIIHPFSADYWLNKQPNTQKSIFI